MATDNHYISDQLLAAYLDGNTTVFETHQVLDTIRNDPELQEVLNIAMQINEALLSPDSFVKSAPKKAADSTIRRLFVLKNQPMGYY